MDFSLTSMSVLSLIILALPGFILVKLRALKPEYNSILVTVLLYVCQPFITINSFLTQEFDSSLLANIGIAFVIGIAAQLIMAGIASLIFKADRDKKRRAAYVYSSAFGNVGFMGIPVVAALMPEKPEAILYVAVFMVSFNLLCWTLGIYIITGEKKYISLKKAILNPPVIALIIALPFFFFKVKMPSFLMTPIGFFAEMNTPLAMIILGMRFADIKLIDIVKGWGIYVTALLKLIICPLLMLCALLLLPLESNLELTMMILSAMPGANMVLMMAEKYDGDKVSATKGVLTTTLFSVLTVPLMMLFTRFL